MIQKSPNLGHGIKQKPELHEFHTSTKIEQSQSQLKT